MVNLSLGTVTADGEPPLVLLSALRAAIAIQPEILFVCAAGNYADTRECWPGAFSGMDEFREHVVSVAALRLGRRATVAGRFVGAEWSIPRRLGDLLGPRAGRGLHLRGGRGDGPARAAAPGHLRQGRLGHLDRHVLRRTADHRRDRLTMQQDGWKGTPMRGVPNGHERSGADVVAGYGTSISILPVLTAVRAVSGRGSR